MEFSEAFELNDLLILSPGARSRKQSTQDTKNSLALLEVMMNDGLELGDASSYSPQEFLPQDFSTHYSDYYTEHIEIAKDNAKPQEPGPVELKVTKDETYRETYAQSLYKVSNLTESLKSDFTVKTPQGISISIYLFATQDKMKLLVPKKTTVEQLVPRVISAYLRDEKYKSKPLPCGPIAEAYEIRMLDEASNIPESELAIEKSLKIRDLDADCLRFCVKSGYSDISKVQLPIIRGEQIKGKIVKVYYNKNCNLVKVSEDSTVQAILEGLADRYGYLNPEEFEFKLVVIAEELTEQECDISLDLKISSLASNELKLYRKKYKDTPVHEEGVRKTIYILKPEDEMRFDPQRSYMTQAQASAYKEYEVIKTNSRGKRQKRILGINQLYLFNMTVAEAKELNRGKALDEGDKNILKRKLMSWYKSNAHHPEIPIVSIIRVEQDLKKLTNFYIDYDEGKAKKKRMYETEKASIAVEIVSKIWKLMSMNKRESK
ncbi:hypothetical protein SteCoe_15458 [Stentor coeruleus]|uniref:SIN1-type PH domain-containing protein n=1 Tax=Stentor coeruleus TaxID=5963 RepID=A0A1R2C3J6_9CILI|nr:hypothetical protein SteCoe_15458 [Stentor coeruleus]